MGGRGSYFVSLGADNRNLKNSRAGVGGGFSALLANVNIRGDSETRKDNPSFKNLKRKYNIHVYRSTDNIDEKFLTKQTDSIAQVLENVKNDYNISHKHIIGSTRRNTTTIHALTINPNTNALMMLSKPIRIVYNTRIFEGENGEKDYIKRKQEAIDKHWSVYVPPSKVAVSTTIHELGHALQLSLYRRDVRDKSISFEVYANRMKKAIIDITTKKYKSNINSLSDYSADSSMEWFAETFTSLQLNGKVSPLTKAMDDYLKGMN